MAEDGAAMSEPMTEIVDLPTDNDMYREGERQKCRYRFDLDRTGA